MPGELRELFVSRMRNARSQVGYGRALIELYIGSNGAELDEGR